MSPGLPSASTDCGKSIALPIEATFGVKPCCLAWFQKVVKSGGIITPVMISHALGLEGVDLRREVVGQVLIAAGIGERVALLGQHRREADLRIAPGIAVAVIGEQPADLLVGLDLGPHVGEDGNDVFQPPEEVIGVVERLPRGRIARDCPAGR